MNRFAVWTVVATALGACAVTVVAQIKVVTFKDGRPPMVGTVQTGEGEIRITTEDGRVIPVPTDQVELIIARQSPADQYEKRLLALKADDPGAHYRLAVWCQREGLFDQAGYSL